MAESQNDGQVSMYIHRNITQNVDLGGLLQKLKLYVKFNSLSDGYQQYTLQFVEEVVNRHYLYWCS